MYKWLIGWIAIALVQGAHATLLYRTSFEETEGFVLGDLNGQMGWESFSSTPFRYSVTDEVAVNGTNSVRAREAQFPTGPPVAGRELVPHFTLASSPLEPVLIADVWVNFTIQNNFEWLGLAAANASWRYAVIHIQPGRARYFNGINYNYVNVEGLTPNTWHKVSLEIDLLGKVARGRVNGIPIGQGQFNDQWVTYVGLVMDSHDGSSSLGFFDEFEVTSVPEATGLVTLSSFTLLLLLKRRSKSPLPK